MEGNEVWRLSMSTGEVLVGEDIRPHSLMAKHPVYTRHKAADYCTFSVRVGVGVPNIKLTKKKWWHLNIDIEKLIQDDLCGRTNKDTREKAIREYYSNPSYCQYCGNIILVDKNDKISHIKQRKFCSEVCFHLSRKTRNRICINCGNELNATSKKYCSIQCQSEYEQKMWEEKWLNGKISGNKNSIWIQVSDRVRTYLFKKYGNTCSKCGWGEINPYTGKIPLEVEHIDGDANNTTPENVTLLCPNCHSLTATYRGANRGNGRPKTWIPKSIEVEV